MSIMEIEENLILDEGSQVLKDQFDMYCNWCWGHGYGSCDVCRKVFNHYYVPIRIAELQKKNNIICIKNVPSNRTDYPRRHEIKNWIEKHERKKKKKGGAE